MIYGLTALMTLGGIILLRLAGRKSISQMTFGTAVVMISLGNLLVEPFTRSQPLVALGTIAAMLITLVVVEWVQVKSNFLENFFSGKAIPVIQNGQILERNLKKVRMPVDKLEMRLRQKGVKRISDVKSAMIEVTGDVGYELRPGAEPLTLDQFELAMKSLIPEIQTLLQSNSTTEPSIFEEMNSSSRRNHPERLQ